MNAQNKILGKMRFRQLRGGSRECVLPSVRSEIKACYDYYTTKDASNNPYGSLPPPPPPDVWLKASVQGSEADNPQRPTQVYIDGRREDHMGTYAAWKANYDSRVVARDKLETARYMYWWLWKPAVALSQLDTADINGRFGTYSGDGFIKEISLDEKEARSEILGLKANTWIDQATSAIVVNINAYNGNLDRYVIVTVLFELPPTGRVFPLIEVKANRLYKYYRQYDSLRMICEILVCGFLVYFMREEYQNIQDSEDFWTWASEVPAFGVVAFRAGSLRLIRNRYRYGKTDTELY